MKILRFKTNIENQEMLKKVAPILDMESRISKWNIDMETEENILSVSGESATSDIIHEAIEEAGFEAEMIRVIAIGGEDL